MKRIVLLSAVVTLAVAAWVVGAAGGARAQNIQPQLTVQDGCKIAAANTTLTWSPTAAVVQATSTATYGTRTCSRYVADFQVGQLTPLGGHTTNFQISPSVHWTNELLHLDAAQCQTLVLDATMYRRTVGTNELVRIGGGRQRGAIQSNTCMLAPEATWVEPPLQTPPTQGTMTIRVAAAAKLGQQSLPVRIMLHRPY
jgi:hypothetical protein